MTGHVATAATEITASPERVWAALTDPASIRRYMFGADVRTDWQVGSPIVWQGVFEGKAYEDKGEILELSPGRRLRVTHFSPLAGQPDVPENYHALTYDLEPTEGGTRLSLSQDNNASPEEAERATGMWQAMLAGIKDEVEAG